MNEYAMLFFLIFMIVFLCIFTIVGNLAVAIYLSPFLVMVTLPISVASLITLSLYMEDRFK